MGSVPLIFQRWEEKYLGSRGVAGGYQGGEGIQWWKYIKKGWEVSLRSKKMSRYPPPLYDHLKLVKRKGRVGLWGTTSQEGSKSYCYCRYLNWITGRFPLQTPTTKKKKTMRRRSGVVGNDWEIMTTTRRRRGGREDQWIGISSRCKGGIGE